MKPYSRAVSEPFAITSPFKPMGDQPRAIEQLVHGVHDARRYRTLLGATGTGKTFTIANVIERVKRPTLVVSHNKTLAATSMAVEVSGTIRMFREFQKTYRQDHLYTIILYT